MRLFSAINFDESSRRRLAAMRESARGGCPEANFSRDENLHLTLAFLGEVSEEQVPDVTRAMHTIREKQFTLCLGGREPLGGGLLCVSVKPDRRLCVLQKMLCNEFRKAGFFIEEREFRPHITLAREYHAKTMPEFPSFETTVRRVSLMKSERIQGRLTYTELYFVDLR